LARSCIAVLSGVAIPRGGECIHPLYAGQAHWHRADAVHSFIDSLQWPGTCRPQKCLSCGWSGTPSNTWFLGPTWVSPLPCKWHLSRFSHSLPAYQCAQHRPRYMQHL